MILVIPRVRNMTKPKAKSGITFTISSAKFRHVVAC